MPIHSQSMLIAGRGLPCPTAQIAAIVCQTTSSSTAASVAPKRSENAGRPAAAASHTTASISQSITSVSPSPNCWADSLGNSGRATISAIMPASSQ